MRICFDVHLKIRLIMIRILIWSFYKLNLFLILSKPWPQVVWSLVWSMGSHPKDKGTQRFIFSYIHQNVYSEVPSKEHRKVVASKFSISYQNEDLKKSNVYEVILSQIR